MPPASVPIEFHALELPNALLALDARCLCLHFARDVDERDHDVRDRALRIEHGSCLSAHVNVTTIATMNDDVVDDDGAPLHEREHERELVLRIELAGARADSVGLGVLAARDVVPRRHPHDLRERVVRVQERAVGRARDPYTHGQVVGNIDDRIFYWHHRNHPHGSMRGSTRFW